GGSKVTFSNFEGSTKNKKIKERDCIIYLASMQKPDALRSADVMMAHLSEVGLWKETEGKKPEDLVQSIAGTVPLEPYSMIVMESTAKGVGNFFHREWQKANSGESGYTPVFVAWYEIEMYQKPFASDDERLEFILSMTDKEHYCFELGATLEAINWYRNKKYTDSYDDWRMGCEFPTTPEEAFQSTGKRAHSPSYVGRMRKFCMPPLYKGDIFASAEYGKEALVDLKFEQVNNGFIWLWALPDTSINVTHRYVVSMDIGGRTDSADWSVISIIDRYWLSDGGVEECIGTARFHLDQDLAIWKATQIARFYNNALLVVEANSLNSKGTEGDHTLTILDEIRNYYDNIYYRIDTQRLKENLPVRYGFHTNRSTKTDLVNQMNKRFREMLHIERDHRALDEADYYEIKQNGSYGAVDGGHDDIYMSRAIGLKASDSLPIPKTIEQPSPRSTNPYKRSSCKNAPLFK
ncbi:MAG: terminase, partial [Rikenellaceae bacterium]